MLYGTVQLSSKEFRFKAWNISGFSWQGLQFRGFRASNPICKGFGFARALVAMRLCKIRVVQSSAFVCKPI